MIFAAKILTLGLIARALSPLCLGRGRQRSEEKRRQQAAAAAGKGRGDSSPLCPYTSNPLGCRGGAGPPGPSWFPTSSEIPHRWCAWKEGKCLSGLSACALHQVSLLSAGWQEENAGVKGLQGTEKSNAE